MEITIERLREASRQVLAELAAKRRDPVETLRNAAGWELVRASANLGDALDSVERVLAHLEEVEEILTYLSAPGQAAVAIAMEAEGVPGDLGILDLRDRALGIRDILVLSIAIVEQEVNQ